jgi:hypothetical protein
VSTDSTLTVLISGRLDASAGAALLAAVRAGLVPGTRRVNIDLRDVDDFTLDGAASLVDCRELGDGLAEGVRYRTAAGPGSDALLTAFSPPDE